MIARLRDRLGKRKLQPGEIDLWWASVSAWQPWQPDLYQLLSPDERARAERFKVVPPRNSFIVAHAFIRLLLAAYLDHSPDRLQFRHGSKGKPFLDGPAGRSGVSFNLSHSGDLVIAGLAHGVELGVDVEYLREMPNAMGIAERFFAGSEHSGLLSLPHEIRNQAFFRCWTYKEAYLKAIGSGIGDGLERIESTVDPNRKPSLLRINGSTEAARAWTLLTCEPAPGHVAAVVVPAGRWQLNLSCFSPSVLGSLRSRD